MTIRYAILCHADKANELLMSGEIELDESYFGGHRKGNRGRGAAGKVPVFGILTRGGKAYVEVVPNVQAQTLLGIAVKKVRHGSVVSADKYKTYDSLMCCGHRHLNVAYKTCNYSPFHHRPRIFSPNPGGIGRGMVPAFVTGGQTPPRRFEWDSVEEDYAGVSRLF